MHSTSFSSSFRVLGFRLSSLIKVFLLVQDERYMSNLILLHVDTQSFLSDLFTMLSFLWCFWQCCQKTDCCHLDILLHWSTAWFMPMIFLLFFSPFLCTCKHLFMLSLACENIWLYVHIYTYVYGSSNWCQRSSLIFHRIFGAVFLNQTKSSLLWLVLFWDWDYRQITSQA